MDDLANYVSEEDEDYVYEGGASDVDEYDDDEFGGPDAVAGGKRKRRKKGGLGAAGSARPAMKEWTTKKPKKGGVGAAVLSDDDDDEPMRPLPPRTAPPSTAATAAAPQPSAAADATGVVTTPSTDANDVAATNAASDAPAEPTATDAPASATASAAPSSSSSASALADIVAKHVANKSATTGNAPAATVLPITSASTATTPTATSAPAAASSTPTIPSSSQSLAQIMANFKKPTSVLPTTTTKPTTSVLPNQPTAASAAKPAVSVQASAQAQAQAKLAAFMAKTAKPAAPAASSTGGGGSGGATLSDDKIVVKEITSFAGETMEITKTILKGSAEDKLRQRQTKDNLASLVASLTAKKSMSTLAKSQVDWQISKDEEGDSAELEKATKNGYVDKMAFLAKTDLRQFEREKEARNATRRMQEAKARQQGQPAQHTSSAGTLAHDDHEQDDDEPANDEAKDADA